MAAGEAVKIAVRPENIRLGVNGAAEPNTFTAQVAGQRYQGTQTVYELDMLGGRLEALELGTSVRYPVGSDDRGGAAAGPVLGLSREPERRGVTSSTRHPGRDACIAIRDHVQLCFTTDPG